MKSWHIGGIFLLNCHHPREEPGTNGGNSNEARYGYLMEGSATVTNGRLAHGKRTIMAYQDPNWVYTDKVARYSDDSKYNAQSYRVGNCMNDNQDQGGASIHSQKCTQKPSKE